MRVSWLKLGAIAGRADMRAGRLAAFRAAIPHQIVDADGKDPYFIVTLPLGEFLAAELPTAFVSRILHELLIDAACDGHRAL